MYIAKMTTLPIVVLFGVVACGCGSPNHRTLTAPPETAATRITEAAPSSVAICGPWIFRRLLGGEASGLLVHRDEVVVGTTSGIGPIPPNPEAPWVPRWSIPGAISNVLDLHSDGETLSLLITAANLPEVTFDTRLHQWRGASHEDWTLESGTSTPAISGAVFGPRRVALDSSIGTRMLTEYDGTWSESSSFSSGLIRAAFEGRDGEAQLILRQEGHIVHWTLPPDGEPRRGVLSALLAEAEYAIAAECDGRLFAATLHYEAEPVLTWLHPDSESYQAAPVGTTHLSALALSLACDPFLFDGAQVWSRSGTHWNSVPVVTDAEGRAELFVHENTLYLLFHRVTGDGIEAWLATSPLCLRVENQEA